MLLFRAKAAPGRERFFADSHNPSANLSSEHRPQKSQNAQNELVFFLRLFVPFCGHSFRGLDQVPS
jgi:hypothetical protein